MRRFTLTKLQVVFAATLFSSFISISIPVLAQSGDGGPEDEQSILFDSTIAAGVDASKATTVADPTLPPDQLNLLIKPLTVEELQIEAAAWLILVKDKANEIAKTEVAIKRINQTLDDENAAIKAEEEAIKKLDEAEAAQAGATEGTPAYEAAAKKFETAKKAVQEATQKKQRAEDDKLKLGGDEDIQAALQEARSKGLREQATGVLGKARTARDQLTAGSEAYNTATANIDALNKALLTVKTNEEKLETAVPGSPEAQAITQDLEEARQTLTEAVETIDPSVLEGTDIEIEATDSSAEAGQAQQAEGGDATEELESKSQEDLEAEKTQLEEEKAKLEVLKEQLLANSTTSQADRAALIDRLNLVLASIDTKGGDTASYRKYVGAISTLDIDVTDTEGLGVRLVSWLFSEEGGLRLVISTGSFLCIIVVSWGTSIFVSRFSERMLIRVSGMSNLFRGFTVMVIKRGILIAGIFLALATIGVNLGPVLAVIGGASFVLAFALQSNLGNFASGLMLLVNKPFDVGDEVKVAGYWAYVDSISLASTKLKDFDGNIVTVPNNTVWGGDITNYTHAATRKLKLAIHVKFSQDMGQISQLWMDLAAAHPKVLKDPAPGWFPWNAHYDYYIWIGLTAWSKTDDYWSVHIEMLQALQARLEELNIELAAPIQNVMLHQAAEKTGTQSRLPVMDETPDSRYG